MDYALAIRRNRDQIRTIVLALFALARMRVGGSLFFLPRSTFAAIMLVLRPAESCVRRLIVIAAHGLKPAASHKPGGWPDLPPCGTVAKFGTKGIETESDQEHKESKSSRLFPFFPIMQRSPCGGERREAARGGHDGRKAFKLFDPLKHFDPDSIWDAEPVWHSGYNLAPTIPTVENPGEPLPATHIGQRLNALIRALDNLPAQARRLVRHYARRDALLKACKPTRWSPMRPGLPPGWRERKLHEIDDVLRECHGLAHDRLNEPDTS